MGGGGTPGAANDAAGDVEKVRADELADVEAAVAAGVEASFHGLDERRVGECPPCLGQRTRVGLAQILEARDRQVLEFAYFSTRWLESLRFAVSPVDPPTFVSVIGLLGLSAILACYLPARRAAAVDPVIALRHE